MQTAIITGGTGMVALALERMLVNHGVEVTLVIRPNSPKMTNMNVSADTRVVHCDIGDLLSLKEQNLGHFDAFYHFAWDGTFGASRNDTYLQSYNVRFTLDAVELAAHLGCGVFLGAGSQAEYGRVDGVITSTTPTFPENGYGIAKLAACGLSRIACSQKGIRHIWARIFSLYGQCDGAGSMMMSCVRALVKGERMSFTKGEQLWDYLYCDDAAQGFYKMGLRGRDGAVYPLASGRQRTLAQYITAARDVIAPGTALGLGDLPYQPGQVMSLCADINELRRDTGFEPAVSFEDGIQRTANWVKERIDKENLA